jgi:threonine synthase
VPAPLAERYRDRLPLTAATPIVSLGEGSTPLLRATRIGPRLGIDLWLKWEAGNPTGSFKDRGMTIAVSKALENRATAIICASTGNTASSAAAYAARAGMPALVLQPEGAVASGKLAQTRAYGARVLAVRGSFDEALAAACELAERGSHALVNSVNPYRLEGQKTVAFEIVEELGAMPDAVYLPYGGGGNTTALAKGLLELPGRPARIVPVQARQRETTVASAIRIASPVHVDEVADALERTGGEVATVSDEDILRAWQELAVAEGLFCEPASAAGLAALAAEPPDRGTTAVCVVTGHGLKDPETAARLSPPTTVVDPDPDAITAVTSGG